MSVDGHELRWWVRRTGRSGCTHCDPLSLVIAAASRKGCVVQVYVYEPFGPDPERPITPAFVAGIARSALAAGWEPGVGSGPFQMPSGNVFTNRDLKGDSLARRGPPVEPTTRSRS